jgi:hypothetical protein
MDMPGNLIPAAPTDVMPAKLSRAFHADLHLEADLNMYPDGSSDRNPLAQNDRHYFQMQQTLSPDDWQALRSFYDSHLGRPFYFYNLRETVPPWSWDPTGASTVGRYTVVFDGQWSETYGYERGEMILGYFKGFAATVSLGLREVV